MTYVAGTPQNSDSPGIFPAQSRVNFTRLQTLISADHQFNDSAQPNDGYHNLIRLTEQAPSGALASLGRLYAKTTSGVTQLFYMDSTGAESQLTPKAAANGLFAAVNFSGVGAAIIRSSFNVSSVVRTATGTYTITFSTPAANNNYMVQATGMRNQDRASVGSVLGNATYGNSVAAGSVKVKFFGSSSDAEDVLMGNVMIYII